MIKFSKSKELTTPRYWNIVKMARGFLRDSQWDAWLTDKDGGYALVPKEAKADIDEQILSGGDYKEVPINEGNWDQIEPVWRNAMQSIIKHDDRIKQHLLTSSMFEGAKWISNLNKTVKTHKPQGEITCRAIHSTCPYTFAAIGRWVAKILNDAMSDVRHVIKDTMELIEYIKSFDVNANTWMLKADGKDSFLTGSEDELVRSAVSLVEPRMKVPLARAVEFLLWSQFVRSIHHPKQTVEDSQRERHGFAT